MPLELMAGLGAALAVLLALVAGRWVVAYLRADGDSPLRTAFSRTGKWSLALVGGIGSATAMGIIQFADVITGALGFVAAHPYFATNVGTLGLGAGALSGLFALSTAQFVGIGLGIVGVVLVVVEVDNA